MKLNVMSEQTACLMDSWVKDWSGNITEKGKNENVVLDIFLGVVHILRRQNYGIF